MDREPILYTWNDGAGLAYQVVGEGSVDLVYLPAAGSNLDWNWRLPDYARFLRRLASFSRLILTDRRGWGCSDRFAPGVVPDLEMLTEDLLAVCEAAAARPPALLAVNESGWLGITAVATRPEHFSRLILFGCSPVGARTDDLPWEISRERLESNFKSIERTTNMKDWARVFVRNTQPSLVGNEEAVSWLATLFRLTAGPGATVTEVRSWPDIDLRHLLPAIRVPTLVLHRADDPVWKIESSRYLAEHIPGAQFVELPGRDGYPWVGEWEAVVEQIEQFVTGTHAEPEPVRVLATVLFTDIVGSARRAAELGDRRWRDVLERHHDTIRRLLVAHRGRELDTAGDGFLATFDVPARAIRCGLEILRDMEQLGLELRVGIHTGECEVIDDKIAGVAVAIGARIIDLAEAGEVLISETVKGLVMGSGFEFTDRGIHELRGLPGSWRLYAASEP